MIIIWGEIGFKYMRESSGEVEIVIKKNVSYFIFRGGNLKGIFYFWSL